MSLFNFFKKDDTPDKNNKNNFPDESSGLP